MILIFHKFNNKYIYFIYDIINIILVILLWIFLTIIFIVVILLLNIVIFCCIVYQFIRFQKIPNFLSEQEIEHFENTKIINICSKNTISNTINILNSKIHRFIVYSDNFDKNDLILLHGTFSSAYDSWIHYVDLIKNNYNQIHVINLPGFGRSKINSKISYSNTINYIIKCLAYYIIINKLKKPTIVSISFSTYITILLAKQYPFLINKIILISPISILPTLSKYGFYSALMFKYIIPYISKLNRGGLCLIHTFCDEFTIYKFNICLNPNNINYLAESLIDISWTSACFNNILFTDLIKLKVPFGLIYGSKDLITPSHTGKISCFIMNCNIPIKIIDGAGHSPQSYNIEKFNDVFNFVVNNAKICNNLKLYNKYINVNFLNWRTSYSINKADQMINKFYNYLNDLK